jgi:hypothetical protein
MTRSPAFSYTAQRQYLSIPSKLKPISYRLYDPETDEAQVCDIVHAGALPGGRRFPLVPQTRSLSFGRIITGPFAQKEPDNFIVAIDHSGGEEKVVSYLTGALREQHIEERNRLATQIALNEFGGVSLLSPLDTLKAFITVGTAPKRTLRFLLHAMHNQADELPQTPPEGSIRFGEWHWSTHPRYRGHRISIPALVYFLDKAFEEGIESICIQVTVCDGSETLGKALPYYLKMNHKGAKVWELYDIKETHMYTEAEKQEWRLGAHVYNASLYSETELLLAFTKSLLD